MTGETNSNKRSVGPVRYSVCSLRGDVQAQRKLHHWYADPPCLLLLYLIATTKKSTSEGVNTCVIKKLTDSFFPIDLACSESLAKTGTVEKVRMEEAKYNNKSLLTLTQVISRLSGGKPR